MLVLGGSGRLYGALVGSALFLLLREIFSDLQPAYWQLWVGLLVMLSAFVARGGVVGAAARLLAKARARRLELRGGGHT
jgi:branched-chain amino acid transport system permease protein